MASREEGRSLLLVNNDDDYDAQPCVSTKSAAPTPAAPTVQPMSFLALFNTFLLLLLLAVAVLAYREVSLKTQQVDEVMTSILSQEPNPEIVRGLSSLLRDVAGDFFFGSGNGTIPNFFISILTTDFGTWAKRIHDLALNIENKFQSAPVPVSCTPNYIPCNGSQWSYPVHCQNGETRWCQPWTPQVDCREQSCIGPAIITGASYAVSISQIVSAWQQLSGPPVMNSSAFSNGIFRLDLFLNWIEAQTSTNNWQQAGKVCNNFVTQMKLFNWQGSYVNGDGNIRTWDGNRGVRQFADMVNQVCSVLKQNSQQPKKPPQKKH
jgi:hypothetical protein